MGKQNLLKSVLLGITAGLVLMLLLSLGAAVVIHRGMLPIELLPTLGATILVVSCFIGCVVAGRLQGGKLLVTTLITAAALLAVTLLCKAAFFAGWSEKTIPALIAAAAAAVGAAFLPQRKSRRRRH